MKAEVNLPLIIEGFDHTELEEVAGHYRKLIKGLKVLSMGRGCNAGEDVYLGVAYIGSLRNPKNQKAVQEVRRETRRFGGPKQERIIYGSRVLKDYI